MTTEFSKNNVLELIKKRKERIALVGVVVIFILVISGGIILQKTRPSTKEFQPESVSKTVELKFQHKKEGAGPTEEGPQVASFSLKPSPDDLLQQLSSLENLNEDVLEAKYTGLRVLWPAYFFTLQTTVGSKATLVLDVDEDGFGVVIESDVDASVFPQLRDVEPGKKLWIGGTILAVDRSGTGTVYMKTEHLKFGDDPIVPANRQPAK
jgi:hypothetical protein